MIKRVSVDDGCSSDMRLSDLCTRFEIPLIVYLPVEWRSLAYDNGYKPLNTLEAMQLSNKHEIGSHTITHRHLTKLDLVDATDEIVGSQRMLQKMFNQNVTKFCPPRGYSNPILTELTLKFYESQRLTKGKELVHIHPDSGANKNIPWQEAITDDTEELWCHSWELNKYNLWEELEEYFKDGI